MCMEKNYILFSTFFIFIVTFIWRILPNTWEGEHGFMYYYFSDYHMVIT